MSDSKKPDQPSLLAEYAAANDAYMHYDNFSWQVGAVLIAGAFVFWGFLIESNADVLSSAASSILVSMLLSVWILYSAHNRQIYLCKLHRLHEIEKELGLKQHVRWHTYEDDPKQVYRTFGPKGHTLNKILYALGSLGAPAIGILQRPKQYLWSSIPLVFAAIQIAVVLWWIQSNERALKASLPQLENDRTLRQTVG